MSDNTLIKRLKPWVTTFSEAIKLQHKHGDEICVGGEIKSIFSLSRLMGDTNEMTQINIDDRVGEMVLFVPGDLYEELDKKYALKEGDEIIATGKVFDPTDKLVKGDIPSIMCWKLELLSSKK